MLGLWLFGAEGESARNWEEVLKDVQRCGMKTVRIFVTDDLPGVGEAINKLFPGFDRQLCVLHAVRDSLARVRKKERETLTRALKGVYQAEGAEEAKEARKRLRTRWGGLYPKVAERWERRPSSPPSLTT